MAYIITWKDKGIVWTYSGALEAAEAWLGLRD